MAGKFSQTQTYSQYVASLKPLLAAKSQTDWPKIIVLTGSSVYLQQRTCQALIAAWKTFDLGDPQSIEVSETQQSEFRSLWSQVSLFESKTLFICRRSQQNRAFGSWLSEIKSVQDIKSNFVFEFSEKLPADVAKQLSRLGVVMVSCVEPSATQEFERVAESFCRRRSLSLAPDAIKLVVDSMGHDLAKIENQIDILSLQFHGVNRTLSRIDVASSIGTLREDDVFELFDALRRNNLAEAHLLSEAFIDRGESAIALTGIFARFAREQLEKGGSRKGMGPLSACASADRRLKSSRVDESLIISSIIDSFAVV